MRFRLFERALRDSQMLHEIAGIFPPVAFRNIGRNGSSRAPDLRRQPEQFVARKWARQSIARLGQGHGVLPKPQVPIRIDRWVAQKSSLFATRHSLFATSLLIARQRIIRAFPWREEIEFAEFLIETDGFVDHPLLLVVVADLDEAGEWKILAQRMAVETVVGQQPPHVGMAREDHAIEVVGFALEPIG